jgi:hypothetical protein
MHAKGLYRWNRGWEIILNCLDGPNIIILNLKSKRRGQSNQAREDLRVPVLDRRRRPEKASDPAAKISIREVLPQNLQKEM